MKTNFYIITMVIAIAFAAVSCGSGSSVDAALAKIEKAVDKVEKNKTSMTEADWEALEKELEQPMKVLSDALENNQVGAMKKLKITAAMMRYMAVLSEAALHTVTDELKVVMEETQLANEEMQEVFDSEEMKQAMQELQKAVEELQKLEK